MLPPELVVQLQAVAAHRSRLERERLGLLALNAAHPLVALLGIGALRTRADSLLALIGLIDQFLDGTVPRLSQAAANGEPGALEALARATQNILQAVGDVRPFADVRDDGVEAAQNTVRGIVGASVGIGTILGGLALVVLLARLV